MKLKIWISPYKLWPFQSLNRYSLNAREGFLIKIQTADLEAGYADCHPLREFGDKSVEECLLELRSGQIDTPLLKKSLYFAKKEGRAREEKRRLFSDIPIKSHYTCTDLNGLTSARLETCLRRGFTTVKVKIGKKPREEARQIHQLDWDIFSQFRWRFDANSKGGDLFLKNLRSEYLEFIDFIEDPTSFRKDEWEKLGKKYGVLCAFDRPEGTTASAKDVSGIRVVKPARDMIRARARDVITNCMDHPLGQSMAFWTAQHAVARWTRQTTDYGLQTDHLFKRDSFFAQIHTLGPYFKASEDGYGAGFSTSLKRLKWQSL